MAGVSSQSWLSFNYPRSPSVTGANAPNGTDRDYWQHIRATTPWACIRLRRGSEKRDIKRPERLQSESPKIELDNY